MLCGFCGDPILRATDAWLIFFDHDTLGYPRDVEGVAGAVAHEQCAPTNAYDIPLWSLRAEAIDWHAHLSKKTWYSENPKLSPILGQALVSAMSLPF